MTSPSNTGGRNGTVSYFMVLRSIVDNSFQDRCILPRRRRQSMMLGRCTICDCMGGTASEESQGETDGVADTDFTTSGWRHGMWTEDPGFCPFALGDSPPDSLDNSIIGSSLSTFTTESIALVGEGHRASLGGLRSKARGLHGI